jgi:predicted small lipoprotein YifL
VRPATITAALLCALALAACGEKQEGPFPLDAAAVKAAVEKQAEVTLFCETEQLALEPDESVTCPAAARTKKGLVQGDAGIRRDGETTEEVTYEISLSGPGGNRVGGGQAPLAAAGESTQTTGT